MAKPKTTPNTHLAVGNQQMTKFWVDEKNVEGVWDAGSIISIMSKRWLTKEFQTREVESVENCFGTKTSDIRLRAVKNT